MRVWVPDEEFAADAEEVRDSTGAELQIDIYSGQPEPPSGVEEVEFFVVPYSFSKRTLSMAASMQKLQVMQLLTAGYEHAIDFVPVGVRLCSARKVHDTSTAEIAMALILASQRGIPDFVRGLDAGEWRRTFHPGLADKTVLIVGHGEIGKAIEARLLPFEVDIVKVASRARDDVHGASELPALLPTADIVVLILPLTEETRDFVDAAFLARLKDGALLVNVARGGVVDTGALVAELESGRLRAALDVTEPEPPPPGHPLWQAPNLVMSPHVGGMTDSFKPRARAMVRRQLTRYLSGEPVESVVSDRR